MSPHEYPCPNCGRYHSCGTLVCAATPDPLAPATSVRPLPEAVAAYAAGFAAARERAVKLALAFGAERLAAEIGRLLV